MSENPKILPDESIGPDDMNNQDEVGDETMQAALRVLSNEIVTPMAASDKPFIAMTEEEINRLDRYAMIRDTNEAKLRHQATYDKLTGLLNYAGFTERLKKYHNGFLVFIDGTNIKAINDKISHEDGDKAIIGIAEVLKSSVRAEDIVARIGGDEFVILSIARTNDESLPIESGMQSMKSRISDNTHVFLETHQQYADAGLDIAVGTCPWEPGASFHEAQFRAEQEMKLHKYEQHAVKGQYRPS
ncbi:GGDEF domain-containing protein [Candidatus Saccharibacteria bacterium]|nr:GGDEF domain-containing protein [Candidatus Saccharibacteria bacterium]MBI3338233.1 GGDEF domain-containing protein [Candidatus Saccharibacteria bacterium]